MRAAAAPLMPNGTLAAARASLYNRRVTRAGSLFRLQQLDLEGDQLAARLEEIRRRLESDEATHRAAQAVARASARAADARRASREAELEVASLRTKIEDNDRRLYGGSVRQPKELQELQHEAEALARHLHSLEEGLFQRMLEVEEAEADLVRAQGEKEEADRQRAHLADALEAERAQLEERRDGLASTREAVTGDVPEDDLSLYNLLRGQLGGVVVARLQEDACSACGLALSASMPQQVRQGTGLVRCPQCGRVLFAG